MVHIMVLAVLLAAADSGAPAQPGLAADLRVFCAAFDAVHPPANTGLAAITPWLAERTHSAEFRQLFSAGAAPSAGGLLARLRALTAQEHLSPCPTLDWLDAAVSSAPDASSAPDVQQAAVTLIESLIRHRDLTPILADQVWVSGLKGCPEGRLPRAKVAECLPRTRVRQLSGDYLRPRKPLIDVITLDEMLAPLGPRRRARWLPGAGDVLLRAPLYEFNLLLSATPEQRIDGLIAETNLANGGATR